jgi:pimeloyl-ACP methyl ester carboxylesterase
VISLGRSGPLLHFAHANGYPPLAYQPLLTRLADRFRVLAMDTLPMRAGSRPEALHDWGPLADELVAFLTQHVSEPVIGAGHSLGAVLTLMAALQQPALFRSLVIIDPSLFSRRRLMAWRAIKAAGLGERLHPLIPLTLRRRRRFASRDEMFARYRRAAIFRRIDDDGLRAYVDAIAVDRAGGVELGYSPEWEARIYYTGIPDLWAELPRLTLPIEVIYGSGSDTFSIRARSALRRALPHARFHEIPGAGHLVPLEKPQDVARAVS